MAIRIALAVLLVAAAAVAVVPALVLFDLVNGGTGWGLCANGLAGCDPGYFAGPELFAVLAVALFILLGLAAMLLKVLQHLEGRQNGRGRSRA
ncbi:MAG: hypothetical protein EHM57_07980 [Actinobacteria bacterium]|nr:MAG: hypothetical protein EHM57_07980 [Actinomycetota bacterium]